MGIHLRPYQRLALYHLKRGLEAGAWRQYIDLPTGTGKSMLAAAFAAQRLEQAQGRVLALVHRQDLALQLAKTLRQEELEVGLVMEGSRTLTTPVVVAIVQSLTPEVTQGLLGANAIPILTVLIDEAHHAVPGSAYERVLVDVEQAAGPEPVAIIGLTATPYRNDEQSMLSLLPVCAFARTIPEMVQEGYLAPLIWKPVQLDLDLAQIATTHHSGERDYAETTLAGQLLCEAITSRLVEHAASLIALRPTLVFAANVQHAAHLSTAFRARGFASTIISGRTGRKQREELFSRWRCGSIQMVCNCALLTEGYDFPGIAALVIARPTLSPGLYMQMLGRGMRRAEGKTDCLVIDVLGSQPDPRSQVVLPHVIGLEVAPEDERRVGEPLRRSDPDSRCWTHLDARRIAGRPTAVATSRASTHTRSPSSSATRRKAAFTAHASTPDGPSKRRSIGGLNGAICPCDSRSLWCRRPPEASSVRHLAAKRRPGWTSPPPRSSWRRWGATRSTSPGRRAQRAGPNVRPRKPSPSTNCGACCTTRRRVMTPI